MLDLRHPLSCPPYCVGGKFNHEDTKSKLYSAIRAFVVRKSMGRRGAERASTGTFARGRTAIAVTDRKLSFDIDLRPDWCKGCYFCIEVCPVQGIFSQAADIGAKGFRPLIVNPVGCTGCLLCELLCPDLAITVRVTPSLIPPYFAGGEIGEGEG